VLNTVQKVDVAQRVDELLFLYTNIRLRHQRNKTTVGRMVPSHLRTDYNGGLIGDCSELLRLRNYSVHTPVKCFSGALVLSKLLAEAFLRVHDPFQNGQRDLKFAIATRANSDGGDRPEPFSYSKIALCHSFSFPRVGHR
jgi:hypothetical protein